MRSWIVILGVASCGGSPPPATAPPPPTMATEKPVPVLTATQVAKPEAAPLEREKALPAPRRFPVAWHTAKAGKNTPAGNAIAFRPDGSLVVMGQGEAERWAGKAYKKRAKYYPNAVASLDASGPRGHDRADA